MTPTPDLRQAMLRKSAAADADIPDTALQPKGPYYRPGREGKSNVTGYFPPAVKRQLRLLAVERDTTIQALLAEALNDLFAKHHLAEIAQQR